MQSTRKNLVQTCIIEIFCLKFPDLINNITLEAIYTYSMYIRAAIGCSIDIIFINRAIDL